MKFVFRFIFVFWVAVFSIYAILQYKFTVEELIEAQRIQAYTMNLANISFLCIVKYLIVIFIMILFILAYKKVEPPVVSNTIGVVLFGIHTLFMGCQLLFNISLASERVYGHYILYQDIIIVIINAIVTMIFGVSLIKGKKLSSSEIGQH